MDSLQKFIQVQNWLQSKNITLVTVSKTKSVAAILARYELGQRVFGENRVQELTQKQATLPADIDWHQIGHLQTNKVKYIAPFVALIHSGDSLKILRKINTEAEKLDRTIDVLLQAKVAQEATKFGFLPTELKAKELLSEIVKLENIRICGLMGMASFVGEQNQIRKEFQALKEIFDWLKSSNYFNQEAFRHLSMGMSGDYKVAIEEGSTMVRIGSLIF